MPQYQMTLVEKKKAKFSHDWLMVNLDQLCHSNCPYVRRQGTSKSLFDLVLV